MSVTASSTITARQRARHARASLTADRAARDKRIEDATTAVYAALDARDTALAQVAAAEAGLRQALAGLREENEPLANIAALCGLPESEVRRLLPATSKKPPRTQRIPPAAVDAAAPLVR